MARREVSQSIPQKADAGGNVLLTIETRPGESWLGSVMVPLANDAAQWQVTVGGVQWGSFAGVNPSTPIQAIGEQVIIQGFGITPGLMLSAIFIGEAYPAHASPNIAPASPNLSPGDQVSLAAGASVGLAPGSSVGVTATGNSSTGTPSSGSSLSVRQTNASGVGSVSLSTATTATLIPAPGINSHLELHQLTCSSFNSSTVPVTVKILRHDNGAVLWQATMPAGSATPWPAPPPFDFGGMALPANVGVDVTTTAAPNTNPAVVNLSYNTVT